MSSPAFSSLCAKLPNDKIKINWNRNPVEMDVFLSFLTIEVEKSDDHLGRSTGWTRYYNRDKNLIISGGIVGGVEYLDSIKYGKNLANPYNNFVNPFYLEDVMTSEGVAFFVEYYKGEIKEVIAGKAKQVESLEDKLADAIEELSTLESEYDQLLKQYEVTI